MILPKKFAILASTGGSVAKTVYYNTSRREFDIDLIITDRECGASLFAKSNNIPLEKINWVNSTKAEASLEKILNLYKIDYLYLFFTRLIKGKLIEQYHERIINFHPSLLPACPGLSGFEDTIKSNALIAGSTIHYIDNGMDTGEQIMQTFTPTIATTPTQLRHIIFAQQCAALYYIHRTINQEKNPKHLKKAPCNNNQCFIPNIDNESMELYNRLLASQFQK